MAWVVTSPSGSQVTIGGQRSVPLPRPRRVVWSGRIKTGVAEAEIGLSLFVLTIYPPAEPPRKIPKSPFVHLTKASMGSRSGVPNGRHVLVNYPGEHPSSRCFGYCGFTMHAVGDLAPALS